MILAQNHVTRLSRYKRVLLRLKKAGLQRVFANNLADAAGMTPSQVRKDFSILGIYGQKRGGYEIQKLLGQIEELLGLNYQREVIVIGYGRIGGALVDFPGFQNEQIKIMAAFDIKPETVNATTPIPVLSMSELEHYLKTNPVSLAILAVPPDAAQQVADQLISLGITGILNLTSRFLRAPETVYINNIDLTMALETVIFHTPMVPKDNPNGKEA
jgi:redox-sensing transcriptional repressor